MLCCTQGVNAILIAGHSDTEKVYQQHHIPCKIETTLYARREKGMVVGMSLYSQIREAYVSGKSIMSNYIIQIRLPDFKCTGKFHFSIILSLASSHKKIYMIRNSPLSLLAYSFIKNTVTNILSPAQPIPSVQSSACPHSVLSLKLGHIRKSLRLSILPFIHHRQ